MEHLAGDGEHHHDEGEEREDGVGGDAECVGVDLGLSQIAQKTHSLRRGTLLVQGRFGRRKDGGGHPDGRKADTHTALMLAAANEAAYPP